MLDAKARELRVERALLHDHDVRARVERRPTGRTPVRPSRPVRRLVEISLRAWELLRQSERRYNRRFMRRLADKFA